MTKLITIVYIFTQTAFCSLSSPILKTSCLFRRDSTFELKVPKGLLFESQALTTKWQACPLFSNSKLWTVSH